MADRRPWRRLIPARLACPHACRERAFVNWLRFGLLIAVLSGPACLAGEAVPAGDLARSLHAYFGALVEERRASGVAAALMLNGRLLFSRGYGYADADRRVPVDPAQTRFSIGSISKTMTATAIAVLLESGSIRTLDASANRYLKRIHLPMHDGKEVSIKHLLTHQGGFEDSVFGLLANGNVELPLSPDDIEARIPPYMDDDGAVSVYSNIGYGILGALIEDVSGVTLKQFLDERVFAPLRMTRTTVRYDPATRIADPAMFHPDGSHQVIPQNWAYHPFIAPSAAVVSTADDMAAFLAANLGEHRPGAPGLGPELWHRLRKPLAGNHPAVSQFGMSLFIHEYNGVTVVENAGSGPGFQAVLVMIPEMKAGLVALIMGGGETATLREKLMGLFGGKKVSAVNMFEVRQTFLEELLGVYRPEIRRADDEHERSVDPTGLYRSSRRPHSTAEALISPGLVLSVRPEEGGGFVINGEAGYRFVSPTVLWKEGVAPFVGSAARSDTYALRLGPDGEIDYITPHLSNDVYRVIPISPGFLRLSGGLLLLLGVGGVWALRDRVGFRVDSVLKYLLSAIGFGCVGLIATIGFSGMVGITPLYQMAYGGQAWIITVVVLANATAVVAAASGLLLAVRRWRSDEAQRPRSVPGGRVSVLACLAAVLLIPIFHYFNLLGMNLP